MSESLLHAALEKAMAPIMRNQEGFGDRMGMLEKFCDVKNTFEGKALAVFMSFVLAFSLVSLTSLASAAEDEASSDAPAAATADDASDAPADPVETPAADPVEQAAPETAPAAPEATEPARSEPEAPATTEPQAPVEEVKTVEPGVASVSLDFTHAYVKYLGQTIALPTESMNAPLNKELVFSAYADTGYEIDHAKTVVNGTETELEANEAGEYVVPADQVTSNLVISVSAQEPKKEEVENDEGTKTEQKSTATPFSLRSSNVINVAVGEQFTITGSGEGDYNHAWYMDDPENPSDLFPPLQNNVSFPGDWGSLFEKDLHGLGKSAGAVTINHRWGTGEWGQVQNVKGVESFTIQVGEGSSSGSTTKLTLSPESMVLEKGSTASFKAVFEPASASSNVTWTSSNTKVATVKGGAVTAVKPGTATITAKAQNANIQVTAQVTVVEKASNVKNITISGDSQVSVGGTTQLLADIETIDGSAAPNVTWTSSNPSAATVDSTGLVTGVLGGSTIITASAGGVTAQHVVNVVAYTVSFYSNYPSDAEKYALDGEVNSGRIVPAKDTYAVYQMAPDERAFTAVEGFNSTNYTFTGWNSKPDGSGIAYQPGASIPVTQNVQLFAQWEGPHEIEKVTVGVSYYYNGKNQVASTLKVQGYKNADGTVTFQLHKQETANVTNPSSTLYAWALGSEDGERYPLGSICTTSAFQVGKDGQINVKAYGAYGTDKTAEFFVLKPSVTNLNGDITGQGNYYYAGTGTIIPTGVGTIDYKTDAFKNVNEYIKTAPSPSAIADIINIGISQAESIRWYKIIRTGNAWHVDGMLYTVGQYWNVNYYDNGELVKTEIVQDGGGFDILGNAPSPSGDGFDSWRYANGTAVGSSPENITGDVNVYSTYKDRFNIIALIDDGGTVSPASQQVYAKDPSTDIAFAANEGHRIVSITETKTDANGGNKQERSIPVDNDKTYTYAAISSVDANYTIAVATEADKFSVTYDLAGGETTSPHISFSELEYGTATPTIDEPTRLGYAFAGWDIELAPTVTENATYTALWERDETQTHELSYTVEYYKNGSIDNDKTAVVTKDAWVNDTMVPVSAGEVNTTDAFGPHYDFVSTDPADVPAEVADGAIIKVYYEGSEDSLTYNGNGAGSGSVEAAAGRVGGNVTVAQNGFVHAGYIFDGWNTAADGSGTTYAPGASFTLTEGDDVLYAQWKEALPVALIYQAEEGGKVTDGAGAAAASWSEAVGPATGSATGSTAQPSPGYRFVGWFVDDVLVSDQALLDKAAVDAVARTADVYVSTTFVAKFAESDEVTLTYVADDGGSVSPASETLAPATGAATGSTAEPQPGYRFVKWTATAADGTTVDASEDATLTASAVDAIAKKSGAYENTTFTAHFEQESVIISYEATEGGSVSPERNEISAVDGGVIGSAAKADEHYYFAGWSVQGSDKIISTDGTISKAVVEKYAKNTEGAFTETTFVAHFAAKKKLTINSKSAKFTYNGRVQSAQDTEYDDNSVTINNMLAIAEGTNVGEYPVKFLNKDELVISDIAGNDVTHQYEVTFVEGMLKITPRPINATGDGWDEPQEYTGFPYSKDTYQVEGFNYWGVERGLVHGHLASADYSISGTEPGEYKGAFDTIRIVDASGKDVTSNYDINKTVGNLEIVASTQPLVITANSQSWKYDGSEHSDNGYTVSYGGTAVTPDSDGTYTLPTGDKVSATVSGSVKNVADGGVGNNAITGYEVQNVGRYTNVTTKNGTLSITPRTVELTSATASKPYDGTALTASGITESGDGWIAGEGAEYNVTGSQTAVASSDNTFEYTLKDGTTAGNYAITKHPGTLTVTSRADDAKFEITVEANSLTDTYDGTAKSVSGLKQTQFELDGVTFTVTGLDASSTETNAGTYGVNVTGASVVTDEEGNVVTDQFIVKTTAGSLVIEKRDLTLASATLSKVYDGTPLVNGNTLLAMEDGWVGGEGATYEFKNSVTLPGEMKPNEFTIVPNEGTNLDNYNVTTKPGQLTIENRPEDIKYAVDVTANSGTFDYDGTEHSVSGFKNESEKGIAVQAGGRDYYVKGLNSSASGTDVADSKAIPVQGIAQVLDENGIDVSSEFKVTSHAGSLTINKRVLTLASQDLTKEYDGTPLKNGDTPLATEEGWVNGEGAIYQFTGSVTLPNTMAPNAFTVTPKPGTILDNYQVDKTEGQLSIENRDAQYDVALTAKSRAVMYDGAEQSVEGFEGEQDGVVPVSAGGQTYYVSGMTSSATGRQANTYQTTVEGTAVVRDADDNDVSSQFNVKAETGFLVIEKRDLTLASATLSKVYDGTPLVNGETPLAKEDGWADGEGATYQFTGSALLAGQTEPNDFTISPNEGTSLDNYNVSQTAGSLTVTNRGALYAVDVTANSGTFTYDGAAKQVSGFENETDRGIPVQADGRTYYVKGLESKAEGTNVDDSTGSIPVTGTAVVFDEHGNKVSDQFDVTVNRGSLTIEKRTVVMTSGSDEKPYDGTPLTNGTVEVTGDGWAAGQGATYNVTGSQTVVGESKNKFTYSLTGGASEGNYTIKQEFGMLRVANADAKFVATVTANSATARYDGTQHTVSGLQGATPEGVVEVEANGLPFYISGLTAEAAGIDANTYTANVVGNPVVKDAAGNVVTDQFDVKTVAGTLTVEKRNVTLESATDEKPYDGTPLTNDTVEVTGDGWADGEGATYHVTGAQTKVGSTPNKFTYELTVATKAQNYTIDAKPGTLTVKSRDAKYEITIVANSATITYDGTEQSVDGLVQTEFVIDGATFTVKGLEAHASGIDAGTYTAIPNGTLQVLDAEGNDVTDQFDVTVEAGSLVVEQRPLTLESATLSKVYDGTALLNGDEPLAVERGWADGEGATYTFSGSVKLPGETAPNAFAIRSNEGTNLDNYKLHKTEGQLTIENRSDDAKYEISVEANSGTFTYNGGEQVVEGLKQTEFTFNGSTYTVTGLEARAALTDVGTATVNLTGVPVVLDAENNVVTDQFNISLRPGTLTVEKRNVTLESATDEKPYDGTPLTNDTVTVLGDGWADGEGADYDVTGSQTLAGFSKNTFTYALTNGAKASNYHIDKREGTLTVTNRDAKYEATVEANSATYLYDGEQKAVSGFKNETDQGIAVMVGDLTYYITGLTAGAELTDAGTVAATVTGNPVVRDADGNEVTSEFNIKPVAGSLTVEKRQVNVTSASATREYSGEELTAHDVIVSGDGWAAGEGASYAYTGTQTLVGFSPNYFTATLNENTKASNYELKLIEGTLTVTPRDAAFDVTVKAASNTVLYDGAEHAVSGFENETIQGIPVQAGGLTYYVTGLTANATGTDAGTFVAHVDGTPVVLDAAGNDVTSQFAITVDPGKLIVSKRSVVLESASGSKAYDGTSLENHNVAVSGDGWADGEGADYRFTGTQTLVGTSDNVFDYVLNGGAKAENYQIEKRYGSLTVTNRDALYEATVAANSTTATYDGGEHAVSGFANETDRGVAVEVDGRTYYVSGYTAAAAGTGAGTYPATVTGTPMVRDADGNDVTDQFAISTQSGSLVIGQRPLTLASASLSKTYDGRPLTNGSAPLAEENGWVEGEGATYVFTGSALLPGETAPNAFVVKAKDGTNLDNYTLSKTEGQLSVENRDAQYEATVTAQSGTFAYDGTEHTVEGFANEGGEGVAVEVDGRTYHVSGLTSRATGANVADSVATIPVAGVAVVRDADGNDVSSQFNVKVEAGSLTIAPAELVIAANDTGKRYGDGDPELTATVTGLVPGDVFAGTYDIARAAGENAGTYEITVGNVQLGERSNYSATTVPGRFIIAPAGEVTLIVNDGSKPYDGTPLTPSGFNPIGLAPDDTIEVVYGGSQTDAGTSEGTITDYIIRNADGADVTANYPTVNVEPGTLRVDPAQAVITMDDATKVAGADDPTFTGTVEGLVADGDLGEVAFSRTNADEEAGVYADVITATFAANPNYTVTVVPGTFTITAATPVTPPTPANPGTPTPTPTPAPLPTPGTPPADNPVTAFVAPVVDALQNAVETVIGPNETPLAGPAEEQTIEDDGTPLAAGSHAWCWVHWYIILGIIVTAMYAAFVALRRGLFSHKLKTYEDDLTGGGDPAPGAPSASGTAGVPMMPQGMPAGATLASGLGE